MTGRFGGSGLPWSVLRPSGAHHRRDQRRFNYPTPRRSCGRPLQRAAV